MTLTVADILNGDFNPRPLTAAMAFDRIESRRARPTYAPLALVEFVRQAWHVLEPETGYVYGWHIDAICSHLEAVSRGEIRNLLINIPPRHAKSLIVSVFWPTWCWTFQPATRWLYASYAQTLSTRDSVKCRRVIESPWYQHQWSGVFQLTSDQNQKTRFENDARGYRLATSVDGSATGEGGDVVVCDDPHNVREAHSAVQRETVMDWWDQVMSTRLNDPKTGRRVIVMQRVHEEDLSGHVLEQGGYEHLCLPTEFEPTRARQTVIGWCDPRTEAGELLWPDRFGPAERDAAKIMLGSYGFAGQHQQRPAPEEGGLFKRSWFQVIDALPSDIDSECRFWDCAGTEGAGDYTVGLRMLRSKSGTFYITHLIRGRWSSGEVDQLIRQTAQSDGQRVRIREEQEPGSSGKAVIGTRTKSLAGYNYKGIPSTGDKIVRAKPFAIQAEAGNVKLYRGVASEWIRDFLDELSIFPYAAHDDQVDAASGAFNELALRPTLKMVPIRGF
jgi:predicted phage terminase large subunit-like protein